MWPSIQLYLPKQKFATKNRFKILLVNSPEILTVSICQIKVYAKIYHWIQYILIFIGNENVVLVFTLLYNIAFQEDSKPHKLPVN